MNAVEILRHESTIVPALGVLALASIATPAFAQNSQSVDIIGTAEAFCTLPTNWQYVSSTSNVSASQFSGTTWSINPTLLADNTGNGIISNTQVAIRVRGQASCNTTHTITLTSVNGGLANASAANPPPGFQASRRMIYDANWTGELTWGIVGWTPTGPGATRPMITSARHLPESTTFDVRLGLLRDGTAGPMVAGSYSDNLIITISIPG